MPPSSCPTIQIVLYFVRSVDLDGGNRQVVVTGTRRLEGLAIYEEYVYWLSSSGHFFSSDDIRIERADRFTGLNRQVIYNFTEHTVWTLRVNHPSKQPTG